MQVEGNRVVRADVDHKMLNRGDFLDEPISDLMIYSSILLNGCAVK